MSRAGTNMAKGTYGSAAGLFNTATGEAGNASGKANDIYGELMPQYEQEARNPQGYGTADLAKMNTAAQQGTGGALASAVGGNILRSQRTRNLGSSQVANNASAENAMRTNSQNALNIEGENANLKQQQGREGRAGLAGLHGQELSTMLGALGVGDQALNTENSATNAYMNANQSGWMQQLMGFINALKPSGSAGGVSFGG